MNNLTKRLVIPEAEEILHQYFPVLDYGFVALKDYMGGDTSVEEFARNSYGKGTRKVSDTRNLLRYLFRMKHSSPLEACEITLHMGMPIFVMRQLVRHRTASLSEVSGRYSEIPMLFYTPNSENVCHQSKKNKQGREVLLGEEEYGDFWRKMQTERGMIANHYKEWVNGQDIAREIARIDLPLSTYTYCYWKCDLRNIFNLISLRSDSHAQWEIQQYSDTIAGIVQRWCPILFEAFQDYQQTSVTFSQAEMGAIRLLSNYHVSVISWESPSAFMMNSIREYLMEKGCSKREVEEFWEKIKVKPKRDFELDLSQAKSYEYFQNLVEESSWCVER